MKIVKPPFTAIVAGVVQSGDPSVGLNPTVQSQLRTTQWIMNGADKHPNAYPPNSSHLTGFNTNGHVSGAVIAATASVVFSAVGYATAFDFEMNIGSHTLRSGNATTYLTSADIVGDFVSKTALPLATMIANLATTIDRLSDFSATSDGVDTITISHKPSLGVSADSVPISFQNTDPTVATTSIVSITQFNGGSPTVGSVLIS